MKDALQSIYRAVSAGRLTPAEALIQVKALKAQARATAPELLLATAQWTSVSLHESNAAGPAHTARKILLWGFPRELLIDLRKHPSAGELIELEPSSATMADEFFSAAALQCFRVIKSLLADNSAQDVHLRLIVAETPERPVAAGLDALLKTAMDENPKLHARLIEMPAGIQSAELQLLLQREVAASEQAVVRYRRNGGVLERQCLRWQHRKSSVATPVIFRERGCYLITGGAGGLGLQFAREIARQTERARIILVGRSVLDADSGKTVRAIAGQGHRIDYVSLDVTQPEAVNAFVARLQSEGQPLHGIIHCAGLTRDNFIIRKSEAEFAAVLAPKVTGTLNLDRATAQLPLDFVLLCSSIAACWGNSGQSDYAAANGFMDDFAQHRNSLMQEGKRRGRTLSVNWPLWQDGSMTLDAATRDRLQRRTGMQPLQTASAMQALYEGFTLGCDRLLVMEGELATMQALLDSTAAEPPAAAVVATSSFSGDTQVDDAFKARSLEYLCQQFSLVLKIPVVKLRPHAPLEQYGMDSILAIKLVTHLESIFGKLPKTLAFEYQTIAELNAYFCSSHAARLAELFALASAAPDTATIRQAPTKVFAPKRLANSPKPQGAAPAEPVGVRRDIQPAEPVAIIGMSGRYPEARDLQSFWRNLRDGKDCIIEVPKERWDWREYFSEDRLEKGRHYSRWGGFIAGVDEFDPRFFNISPVEAETIDPQERLFLQHAWMAMEDAGYTRATLQIPRDNDLPAQVGVYAGVMYGEYQLFGAEASLQGNRTGFASNLATIANRVSYFLNLHGPSMVVDTMCSSSLTAIHLACQDLKLGRTALALAGGVNVTIHPNKYLMLSAGRFISSDGHCQSFGEGGDGYIPGEGVGVVVLKRLSDAKRDGDHIYGVIRGSALNHGGKTNGYTVPNPQAQASVVRQALAEAGVDPRHISYIEAHGTGTKLGDPIEIAALAKVFQQSTLDTGFCLIGSVKSNIGHCESAAGIAALTKVLLQLKHQQIVPSLHSARLNPHIDFAASPFVVNQTLRSWDQPLIDGKKLPRIAGISSFGAGGSNAHLVIEEYPEEVAAHSSADAEFIVPLSARTAAELRQKARDLLDFIRGETQPLDLRSIAYTLQVGREAMDERVAFLAGSTGELAEKLQAYVEDHAALGGAYQGQVKANRETLSLLMQEADFHSTIEKWIVESKHSRLADLWVKGLELEWHKFHATKPQLRSLPAYPFARHRFWVNKASTVRRVPAAALHPLLHNNTSDFTQQSYTAQFAGDEFFLAGPPGERCLSEAACLEMARAAIELSLPEQHRSGTLELHTVAWAQPGVAVETKRVTIALFDRNDAQLKFEIYSEIGDRPVVHCQGIARYRPQPGPMKLDLSAVANERNEKLVELRLSASQLEGADAYRLHPELLQTALHAAADLTGGLSRPFVMASLRVVNPSSKAKLAWLRRSVSEPFVIDLDLCDDQGDVCVQMRGLAYQRAASDSIEATTGIVPVEAPAPMAPAASDVIKIVQVPFDSSPSTASAIATLDKPSSIGLLAPGAWTSMGAASDKPKIALAATAAEAAPPAVPRPSAVSLFDHGNGVFTLRFDALANRNALSDALIEELLRAMRTVEQTASAKVLLLESGNDTFLTGGREEHRSAIELGFYRAIVDFPCPVIAAVSGDAIGAGFLAASVCDFMVCSESARYAFAIPADVHDVLAERYGHVLTADFVYAPGGSAGVELKAKGWTCPILPRDQVSTYARDLANDLARKNPLSLRLLKQHLARHIAGAVHALANADDESLTREETKPAVIQAPSARIRVDVHSERTVIVTIRAQADGCRAEDLLADLDMILSAVDRCVILTSELAEFLPPASANVAQGFKKALLSFNHPVIAALSQNASGIAWYVAQFCDACIHSETGFYSCAAALRDPTLAGDAVSAFSLRFGQTLAKEILMTGGECTGAELRDTHGAIQVVSAAEVLPAALKMADALSAWPAPTRWKHRTASIARENAHVQENDQRIGDKSAALENIALPAAPSSPRPVSLESKVVAAIAHPEGILEVRVADRDAKNMFSDALLQGLHEVFAHAEASPEYKVLVLTGYDSYFLSGGTQDGLLAIQKGATDFTSNKAFQLPLTCSLPVIAAMQGHGIGAGWAMGMYADFALFSKESRYLSPYMEYGFTPGAGSTLMFPEKIGYDLARETLFTARKYSGGELKSRGLRNPVLSREHVSQAAMALARRIAQSPRDRLVALKVRFSQALRASLPDVFERELAMHARTFVGQSDTLARIQQHFASESTAAVAQTAPELQQNLGDITASLKTMLAHELRMEEHEIGDDEPFVNLGLDSITGVTWIRRINEKYGTAIEAIKIYSHPTLTQLSDFVAAEARKVSPGVAAPPVQKPVAAPLIPAVAPAATSLASWRDRARAKDVSTTSAASRLQSIAVIGMAGQFAKANNLEAYWKNIAQGRDCIDEIPKHRWNIDQYYQAGEAVPGKTYGRWMGALEEYDLFDAGFFNISPREARAMDPQQRLFLQACWHGIEHAGYNPKSLAGSKCGVFVGCAANDYHQLSKREQLSGQGFTGAAPSILAGRISYFLDLHGPSLSIDTACSSSLVAIATACDSLVCGSSDVALAGGVNFMSGPAMQIMASQMGMLSPQGRCFSFDERANGIVTGEGVGVVMLKRLQDAERDGDCIYGVIEGWGVNQDGRTNGITAPNPDSQTRLQREVYEKFRIDPAHIQLIEAHGTGTPLGDPIEVAGLKDAFKTYTQAKGYCALGSVKSNIGHCLTAAGVSGFLKILLALKHEQLPPTIHFGALNKHISLQDSPFYINDRLREWRRGGSEARRAAINSFGFSGTNAHLVIAEYRGQQKHVARSNEPELVPLSARTVEQLKDRARDLLAHIRAHGSVTPDIHRIAYTLQVGREAMNERAAFIVSSLSDLEDKLRAFVESADTAGGPPPVHIYRGHVDGSSDNLLAFGADPDFQSMIARWVARKEWPRLADLWVKGLALDWNAFHASGAVPRRIGLPVYPFAKERHWIDVIDAVDSRIEAAAPAVSRRKKRVVRKISAPAAPVVPMKEEVQQRLRASLAAVLDMKPADVDVRKSFTELGLDSIIGVEWVKSINDQYGVTLAATQIYDYPNVKELAAFLAAALPAQRQIEPTEVEIEEEEEEEEVAVASAPRQSAGPATQQIAIIGMSCRFPQSENVDAFWKNLQAGKNCVIEVPADRWQHHADWYHPDPRHPHTSYSKWGGFLDRIDTFDSLFFGISPAEAELIDPQQRIFLEECWKTIESAGYAPNSFSDGSCGVYVGCSTGDYSRVLNGDGQDTLGPAFMGTSSAILAARIAYHLNLKGPALAIDTACSSSLVALHLACESIRSGENELAIAGGINLLATPFGHILTSQVGMPSSDGRCAPFDASANGIVFSEGCGVLLLKSLSAAERDKDNILGVIQGSGTNQDGRTNGITAPSSSSQQQLLRHVYGKFGIDPQRVSYVEAHGTATPLGDPIEVNALKAVFGESTPQRSPCALGSVKSNIGHTGFAAGVAGVVKVLLCMKHRKLVPSIHYQQPNPHIEFETSPFYVNTQCRDWVSDQPRLATVSSFGFSGTNAHVVIEEYAASTELTHVGTPENGKVLVPLSAKSAETLRQRVRDLLNFVRTSERPLELARLAYTLQVGRDAMDHRLVFIVGSLDELGGKLQAWIENQAQIEDVYSGRASQADDMLAVFTADGEMRAVIERWIAQKNLPKVADLWVRGFELDWSELHPGTKPVRMVLPTYPFAKDRCWTQRSSRALVSTGAMASGATVAAVHPLLHRNTSNLSQQSYTSLFAGDEYFLRDHRVNGQPVLPAVAYLEMARAALADAMPADGPVINVELRHVVWSQPIVVDETKRVGIAMFPESDAHIGFEVYSQDSDTGEEVLHCQGSCIIREPPAKQRLDLSRLLAQMQRPMLDGGVIYPIFAAMGLDYGPAFQGVVSIHRGENEALVELRLPDAAAQHGGDYVLHPSLMDSALQGSIALADDVASLSGKSSLPFALESLRILSPCAERMLAWVRYSEGGTGALSNLTKIDIDLCDPDGSICVQMRGFSSRSMDRPRVQPTLRIPQELESA